MMMTSPNPLSDFYKFGDSVCAWVALCTGDTSSFSSQIEEVKRADQY